MGIEGEEKGEVFALDKLQHQIAKRIAQQSARLYPDLPSDKLAFLEEAIKSPLPAFCPEKKPLFVYISEEDIEKLMQPNKAIQLPHECTI